MVYSCVGHGTEGFLLGSFRPGPLVLGVLCFPRLGRGGTRLNLAMSDWDIPPNPDTGYNGSIGYEEHAPRDPGADHRRSATTQHASSGRAHFDGAPQHQPPGSGRRADIPRQQVGELVHQADACLAQLASSIHDRNNT